MQRVKTAERIRGMTDEELAHMICKMRDADIFRQTVLGIRMNTEEEWLEWLKTEVSEEDPG